MKIGNKIRQIVRYNEHVPFILNTHPLNTHIPLSDHTHHPIRTINDCGGRGRRQYTTVDDEIWFQCAVSELLHDLLDAVGARQCRQICRRGADRPPAEPYNLGGQRMRRYTYTYRCGPIYHCRRGGKQSKRCVRSYTQNNGQWARQIFFSKCVCGVIPLHVFFRFLDARK